MVVFDVIIRQATIVRLWLGNSKESTVGEESRGHCLQIYIYIYIYIVYLSHVILSINACGNLSSSSYFYFGGSGRWRTQGIMESNHQFYPLVLVQFPAVGVVYAPKKKNKRASRVSTSQAWSNQIIWSTSSLAVTLLELEV